jgi:hypothetical protein
MRCGRRLQLAKGDENQGVAEWPRAGGEIGLTSGAVEAVQLDDPERVCPDQLRELAAWLIAQEVEEVVMESTALYWRSVWEALERYLQEGRAISTEIEGRPAIALEPMLETLRQVPVLQTRVTVHHEQVAVEDRERSGCFKRPRKRRAKYRPAEPYGTVVSF